MSLGFGRIIERINKLPFYTCNIREFSLGNFYLEFQVFLYFPSLLCFFLSFITTDSTVVKGLRISLITFHLLGQRFGYTFSCWGLPWKNGRKSGNDSYGVRASHIPLIHTENWSSLKYYTHLLLWFYGKQKRGIGRSNIALVPSKSDYSPLVVTFKYFL